MNLNTINAIKIKIKKSMDNNQIKEAFLETNNIA
jgi:hypothetical protein